MPSILKRHHGRGGSAGHIRPRLTLPRRRRGRAALTALALAGGLGLGVVPGSGVAPALAQTSSNSSNPPNPFSYWLVAADGGVFSFGGMPYRGSAGAEHLTKPVVGMAAKASATGYWLVASDGGIFSYGDASFYGSTGAIHLNKPIVGMAPTKTGLGYWLVASDGGIFTYGDAAYYGSTGAIHLAQPIVGMAATPSGHGYWLVASDGGIFAFGDAAFAGSTGAIHLNKPIVGMAPTSSGQGYWMVASDGGIFTFGDAHFFGSAGSIALRRPVVGMALDGTGGGYWLVASDGGIFTYGDAVFRGSTGAIKLAAPVVGTASGPDSNPYIPHSRGYDISWPQCGGTYPAKPYDFGIVGVNDGLSYTTNPCFDSEWAWAGAGGSVYLNVNSPTGPNTTIDSTGPAGNCVPVVQLGLQVGPAVDGHRAKGRGGPTGVVARRRDREGVVLRSGGQHAGGSRIRRRPPAAGPDGRDLLNPIPMGRDHGRGHLRVALVGGGHAAQRPRAVLPVLQAVRRWSGLAHAIQPGRPRHRHRLPLGRNRVAARGRRRPRETEASTLSGPMASGSLWRPRRPCRVVLLWPHRLVA